jgi:2-polyprenyl-3-methyl-5-hydroxy-6-metoxy-1,4-benzoquinol methylase
MTTFPTPLRPTPSPDWPESWNISYHFDGFELWGERKANPGYATAYAQRRARVLSALAEFCPAPGRVLDIAAAQGNFTIPAAQMGHNVTWNDFRGELADYVKLKAPPSLSIDFVPGNILEVGGDYAGAFDAVMALEVIEHVAHPDAFLRSIATLVKPGGHIIVSTPNGGYWRNPLPRFSDCPDPSQFEAMQFQPDADGHIFLLHEDEMRSLSAKAGLEVVRHELFSNTLSWAHVKTRVLHSALPQGLIEGLDRFTSALPGPFARRLNCASLTILRCPSKA